MSLGAGLASAGTTAAGQWSTAQKVVIVGAKVSNASAEVGQGALTISRGRDEAASIEARADAQKLRADAAREQVEVDEAIAMLKEIEASSRRAMNSILAIADTRTRMAGSVIDNLRRV